MDPVRSTPHAGYMDLSWSRPAVKLLVITGVALAIISAMVLLGYPAALLATLSPSFKAVSAGIMIGTSLTIFLFTILGNLKKTPKPADSSTPSSDAGKPKTGEPADDPYAHKPAPRPTPAPGPSTGNRGTSDNPSNVLLETADE